MRASLLIARDCAGAAVVLRPLKGAVCIRGAALRAWAAAF